MFKKTKKMLAIGAVIFSLSASVPVNALTVQDANSTWTFGNGRAWWNWDMMDQYSYYSRNGWHSATAMINGNYTRNQVYNGQASAVTAYYNANNLWSYNSYYNYW